MIHQYKSNGFNIVIDVNTGSIYSVDELTYGIIELLVKGEGECDFLSDESLVRIKREILESGAFENVNAGDIDEAISDLLSLQKEGLLFSEDVFEELADSMKERQGVLKAICLHVAHACNMDCDYCFAGKGEYHDGSGLMSFEVGKKAIDFLLKNSKGRRNLEVDFFGGEPLLNIDVCKKLVEYAKSKEKEYKKNFRFTMTTNGVLLKEEIFDFLNKEMSNVILSLDGDRETNDRLRHTKDGKGTYDIIIDNFRDFVKSRKGKEYYIRGTYTAYNKEFYKDIISIADKGLRDLAMEPVVASSDNDYALSMSDLYELKASYEKLALEMIKRYKTDEEFKFYHYMVDFEGGPCVSKRVSGCGVGTEYLAITPEGEIYPCHQFVGDNEYLLGTLDDKRLDEKVLERFKKCNVYSHPECRSCFAKLYCSGGCAANAYHQNGDINTVCEFSCELHRKRIEQAIMIKLAKDEIDKGN